MISTGNLIKILFEILFIIFINDVQTSFSVNFVELANVSIIIFVFNTLFIYEQKLN